MLSILDSFSASGLRKFFVLLHGTTLLCEGPSSQLWRVLLTLSHVVYCKSLRLADRAGVRQEFCPVAYGQRQEYATVQNSIHAKQREQYARNADYQCHVDRGFAFVARVLASLTRSLGKPLAPNPMQNEPPCHAHALISVPPSLQVSRSRFVVERPDSKIVHLTDIPSTELVHCLFPAISNISPHPSCTQTEAVTKTVNLKPALAITNMLTMYIRMRQSMYVASTSCGRFCRLL